MSSFIHDLILEIERCDPQIKTGILLKNRELDLRDMLYKFQSRTIIQKHKFIDKDYIDMVHASNAEIFAWTVNRPKDIKNMIKLNVDGIISDFPDRVKALLR